MQKAEVKNDNGGEYVSKKIVNYLEYSGISLRLSVEYISQKKGVAERAYRTLVEMARSMLTQSFFLPQEVWTQTVKEFLNSSERNSWLEAIKSEQFSG